MNFLIFLLVVGLYVMMVKIPFHSVKAENQGLVESDLQENVTEQRSSITSEPNAAIISKESDTFISAIHEKDSFKEILGSTLLSLELVNSSSAELRPHSTSNVLNGKKVVGLYFSADWCGPCRKFTPELFSFYQKINKRRGKKNEFEIVWVSRCRDVKAFGQYFTHMAGWYALPPEEAMGERGAQLADKYNVKGIPHLVLLDESGNVITTDARNKIPQDKAGIGFPWRNPFSTLYINILPKSLRLLIRYQTILLKDVVGQKLKLFVAYVGGRKTKLG
jgi:nucleoredoxin